jgi:hypothetical protein
VKVLAVLCYSVAGLALIWGVATEVQQRRSRGTTAIVATLPFGVQAALLTTIATACQCGRAVPVLVYVAGFLGLGVVLPLTIHLAGTVARRR